MHEDHIVSMLILYTITKLDGKGESVKEKEENIGFLLNKITQQMKSHLARQLQEASGNRAVQRTYLGACINRG